MAVENVLATQITLGLLGSGMLQYLKSRSWIPAINANSVGLNHAILLATSAAGALGLHAAWSPAQHSLTITGLDLVTIAASFWVWAKQWAVQFLVHKGAFGPVAAAPAAPAAKP